jgi:hypothetical protein
MTTTNENTSPMPNESILNEILPKLMEACGVTNKSPYVVRKEIEEDLAKYPAQKLDPDFLPTEICAVPIPVCVSDALADGISRGIFPLNPDYENSNPTEESKNDRAFLAWCEKKVAASDAAGTMKAQRPYSIIFPSAAMQEGSTPLYWI